MTAFDRVVSRFLLVALFAATKVAASTSCAEGTDWKKHVIAERGHCNTAVALDVNRDGNLDVIACASGRVDLYIAPDWKRVIPLHELESPRGQVIHSAVLDVDGDGDLDWAGANASDHPFWLENPDGKLAYDGNWTRRSIDDTITGIHCLLASDINNDGRDDLVINNFVPDDGIEDSIAWLSVPENWKTASGWSRHVFADRDARGGSHYMGAADIDGDGWKEIAVGAKGGPFKDGNWFAFWTNPGAGHVEQRWQKTVLAENQTAATNIVPADVNGDGRVDWIASRGHGVGVLWFENPSWKIREIDTEIQFPHSLAVGDFDGDGDVDAATCGYGSERVMWYENDGKGNFASHQIDEKQQSYDLRAIDMDGDGDLDLLNAGRGSKNVVWYENETFD